LKTKKQNSNLRKLFSQKLENAEVMPGPAVKSKLMRQVARKEFLRFNPARFNIYYVAGILITGITAAVLILSASRESVPSNTSPAEIGLTQADTNRIIEVATGVPVKRKPEISAVINKGIVKNKSVSQLSTKPVNEADKATNVQKSNKSITSNITDSLSRNGIFRDGAANKTRLQNGNNHDALLIDPNAIVGCAPLKLKFHNKSASFDSCRWTFGDGGYSNEIDPEWIFDIEGEYKVVLQVFRHGGTISSSTATVTVHPRPQARFEITPDKAVLPNDEIRFMNYSTNSVQFKWDFGDGSTSDFFEPTHTYSRFSNYDVRLIVFSDWGCSDSLTVFNAFSGSEYFIEFPNAFIPNIQGPTGGYYSSKSDEAAQVFHPSLTGVTDYHLKIFSKLGIPIFESNDINLGWDGYHKGQLCEPGVYIWKVRGKYRNGEPFTRMGDVTLLKN
jgi:PKD repeat protein